MNSTRLSPIPALLVSAALAACGSDVRTADAAPEPEQHAQAGAGSGLSSNAPANSTGGSAKKPKADAPADPKAARAATAGGGAPVGYYECYFYGMSGLQNSSMVSMRIRGQAEYEAVDEQGRYSESDGTLRMETGPLAGRVAHMRQSSGKPAIVFLRRENDDNGNPTIDLGDTWCYFEPR